MRPTIDVTQMAAARLWAERSTCSRGQVGAVISLEGRTVGTGYNGAPAGVPHCDHDSQGFTPTAQSPFDWGRRLTPIEPYETKDPGCRLSAHAEANAIAYAARHGVAVGGATIYVTMSPCYACAQLIIAAGLIRVVYDRPYRDTQGVSLLGLAGVEVETTTP